MFCSLLARFGSFFRLIFITFWHHFRDIFSSLFFNPLWVRNGLVLDAFLGPRASQRRPWTPPGTSMIPPWATPGTPTGFPGPSPAPPGIPQAPPRLPKWSPNDTFGHFWNPCLANFVTKNTYTVQISRTPHAAHTRTPQITLHTQTVF